MNQSNSEINQKEYLASRKLYRKELERQLSQITNSKFYKKWQSFTRIKEIFINYLKVKFSFFKKIPNPIKKILKFFYFKYLEINFTLKHNTTDYSFIVKNNISNPKVSILIPTYGSTSNLTRLLASIKKNPDTVRYEILICNDNPLVNNEISNWAKKNKKIISDLNTTILSGTKNLGFVGTINKLAKESKGEFLFLLNDDTEITNNVWLSNLIKPFKNNNVGATGSFLIFPNTNLVQHAGMYPFRKKDGKIWNYHFYKFFNKNYPEIKSKTVPMVTGAALLIKKSLFFKLGMLDYHYLGAGGFDDSDLCNKIIKNGKQIMFIKESVFIHYEGLTVKNSNKKIKEMILQHNQNYYYKKWSRFLIKNYPNYV